MPRLHFIGDEDAETMFEIVLQLRQCQHSASLALTRTPHLAFGKTSCNRHKCTDEHALDADWRDESLQIWCEPERHGLIVMEFGL